MQAENLGRKAKSCSPVVRQGEQKLYRLPTICRYKRWMRAAYPPYITIHLTRLWMCITMSAEPRNDES